LGAVVVALVIWQVAQGVFVKSFSMLGVDVSFQNPNADSTNDGNKVYQSDVSDSAVKIIGRDNFVKQTRGTGNSATIGR
jgi:hypothetical protein